MYRLGPAVAFAAASCLLAAAPQPSAIQDALEFGISPLGLSGAGFDAFGNLYLAGLADFSATQPANVTLIGPVCTLCIFVAKVAGGKLVHLTEIGGGSPLEDSGGPSLFIVNAYGGMSVDPEGDVFLVGGASPDFPTTPSAFQTTSAAGGAYVLKLDSTGTKPLYSTFIGSDANDIATTVTVDSAGNAYVAGVTDGVNFPTTPGAFQSSPTRSVGNSYTTGFVAKFDPNGQLMASTLVGGTEYTQIEYVTSVAVDPTGVVHVGGTVTDSPNFPSTPAAPYSAGALRGYGAFLARLSNDLSQLDYATLLPNDSISAIAVDSSGNSYVGGVALTKINAAGAIVYQTTLNTGISSLLLLPDGSLGVGGWGSSVNFQTKDSLEACQLNLAQLATLPIPENLDSATFSTLDPNGNLTFSTYLGGLGVNVITALALDPIGNLYLAGDTTVPDFPGGPVLIGSSAYGSGFVFELDLSAVPRGLPDPACLGHGAVVKYAPAVPGMIETLYGSNLGPTTGVSFQLDPNGNVPAQLAGTAVTVGGLPAPILYAQESQINFVAPQEITGSSTDVCVTTAAGQNCIFAFIAGSDPAIFSLPNQGYAILNQDGTLNSSTNPAARGSVISLFGTGMGPYDRTLPDGSVAGLPLSNLESQASAGLQNPTPQLCAPPGICGPVPPGSPATVLFAGAAPGKVVGVVQINVLIPEDLTFPVYFGEPIGLWLDFSPSGSTVVTVALDDSSERPTAPVTGGGRPWGRPHRRERE